MGSVETVVVKVAAKKQKKEIVIFLDFDGVLFNPKQVPEGSVRKFLEKQYEMANVPLRERNFDFNSFLKAYACLMDSEALCYLDILIQTILEKYTPKIVVSSNWRNYKDTKELKELLKQHDFSQYIVDTTRSGIWVVDEEIGFESQLNRAEEIGLWLREYSMRHNIQNIIIIDDIATPFLTLFGQFLVHCTKGFFDFDAFERARQMVLQAENISWRESLREHPLHHVTLRKVKETKITKETAKETGKETKTSTETDKETNRETDKRTKIAKEKMIKAGAKQATVEEEFTAGLYLSPNTRDEYLHLLLQCKFDTLTSYHQHLSNGKMPVLKPETQQMHQQAHQKMNQKGEPIPKISDLIFEYQLEPEEPDTECSCGNSCTLM